MKKLSLILALSLALPLTAMAADDDVTIRVMEMHESSADAVMQQIQLPDRTSDQAEDAVANRVQQRTREMHENGDDIAEHQGDMEQEREMEQEHEMEQQHEGMMDEYHDQQNLETDVDVQQERNMDMEGMHGTGGQN